jgi:hypothetical protein
MTMFWVEMAYAIERQVERTSWAMSVASKRGKLRGEGTAEELGESQE